MRWLKIWLIQFSIWIGWINDAKEFNDIINGVVFKKKMLIFLAVIVFFILFVSSYVIIFFGVNLFGNDFFPKSGDVLSSAMWAQVFIMIVGVIVSYFLLNQVRLAENQIQLNRKTATAEAARVLMSHKMVAVRRFLRQGKVDAFFKEMVEKYGIDLSGEYSGCIFNRDDFNDDLKEIKIKIDEISLMVSPFLYRISLEDIEALLNEYNYIGMLKKHGVFDEPLITDMALENARDVYSVLESYIFFRRKSPVHRRKYASHYVDWVKSYSGENK